MHVHVVDHVDVNPRYRAVVEEVIVVPIAAIIAHANISKSVVDAAIVADVPPPVAVVKAIVTAYETPIPGSPKRACIRRGHPASGNPVIAARPPSPVSGSPQIIGVWRRRLIVFRQRRRRVARLLVCQIARVKVRSLLVA